MGKMIRGCPVSGRSAEARHVYLPGLQDPRSSERAQRWRDRYNDRIQREDWRNEITPRIKTRAGGYCERCGQRSDSFDVHHLTYERLGRERDSDLQALCPPCHEIADQERQSAQEAKARKRFEESHYQALDDARYRKFCLTKYGEWPPPDGAREEYEEWLEGAE